MFGVLVVRAPDGELGYLAAFSGMLRGQWLLPGFVPPVFDTGQRAAFLDAGEVELARLGEAIRQIEASPDHLRCQRTLDEARRRAADELAALRQQRQQNRKRRKAERAALDARRDAQRLDLLACQSQQEKRHYKARKRHWNDELARLEAALAQQQTRIERLRGERKRLSQQLQRQLFDGYRLTNPAGEHRPLADFYPDGTVPGGAGDCAGPKLIHHAVSHGLRPLAMAEFWWGRAPADGVRHHGHYYPACRGKCRPILPFMLRGIPVEVEPQPDIVPASDRLAIVYQDEHLVVIDKPAGLLSIPGKEITDSVQTRLETLFPDKRPLLVHRLDLGTSGLLLASLDRRIHRALQSQFAARRVKKSYVALLEADLKREQGTIDLPLRPDLNDRPRQLVCREHGKQAVTRWRRLGKQNGHARVEFHPLTGRTHQLRLHAAHPQGLAAPIVGDELYGTVAGDRMMLHAERLTFIHPASGEPLTCSAPAPF